MFHLFLPPIDSGVFTCSGPELLTLSITDQRPPWLFMLKYPTVLAAEDEESDVFLLNMAFKRAGVPNPLTVVRDGEEAIAYLNGDAPYNDRSRHPLPGLVLLDLNMPRLNGFDVLSWLASHPDLKNLPAVVLSSSAQDSDIAKARKLGAVDYRVKPTGLNNLITLLQEIVPRWLKSVGLPDLPPHASPTAAAQIKGP
jgi:CheY-like chemotaxis protein